MKELILPVSTILLILLNAYFVVCEIILLSARKTRIDQWVRSGNRRAKLVRHALNNLKTFLPTIQVGVTITSIALGLIGSPWLEKLLEPIFPMLGKAFLSFFSFVFLTYAELVFGEMLPKTLTLTKPEAYSLFFIPPLYIFTWFFRPLTFLVNATTYGILGLMGIKKTFTERPYSEQEIKMIMTDSGRTGEISTIEKEMAYNVFKLKRIKVEQIMRPVDDIISFDINSTVAKTKDRIARLTHTYNRYPVYKGSRRNIAGFFHITDLYRKNTRQAELNSLYLSGITRKVLYVTHNQTAKETMAKMLQKKIYLGVVFDKKRSKADGIVSLTDIVDKVIKKTSQD